MSITAITLLNHTRDLLIRILNEYISKQSLISEWIIIRNPDESEIQLHNYENIKYTYLYLSIKDVTDVNLNIASNDIVVYLNDDDYYFDNTIKYCFNQLKDNARSINSSNIYAYDVLLDTLYHTEHNKIFMINKSINSNKSITISSEQLYLKFLHINSENYDRHKYISTILSKKSDIPIEYISHFINDQNFILYKNILRETYDYDIGIIAGGFGCISWMPTDDNLGGSEQAIVNIASVWGNSGKKVIVYGNFKSTTVNNNVTYVPWYYYDRSYIFPLLILWRRYGIILSLLLKLQYKKLYIDLHDTYFTLIDIPNLQLVFDKADAVMLKSEFHKKSIEDYFKLTINNSVIIENGTRISKFSIVPSESRSPYRFCYCSSYDRGLIYILKNMWGIIQKEIPIAELHLYYGMDYIYDEKFKEYIKKLLSDSVGVMYHGRQSVDIIAREKHLSTFQLYITNSPAEIDCISVKESVIAKCIPLISNYGVFKDRQGIHFDFKEDDEELHKKIAMDIVDIAKDFNKVETIRNSFNSSYIPDWNFVANKWLYVI
jgi:hypothetical protein